MGGCEGKKALVRRTGPHRRALQTGEKLLTSRRSSQGPSSCPHSVRRPRRSGAGPGSHFARWQRRHPACGSPEESGPPFPGCPSWRRTDLSVFLLKPGMDLFLCVSPCNHLHPRLYRGCLGLFRAHSTVLCFNVRSPQRGLVRSSTEHRRGEDEDDLPVSHSHRMVVTFLYSIMRPCYLPRCAFKSLWFHLYSHF